MPERRGHAHRARHAVVPRDRAATRPSWRATPPDNPAALTIERGTAQAGEPITITLREGGGFVARLVPGGV